MGARLSIHHVTAEFRAPDGGILPALGPISCDIEAGSFVCLLGPSGGGKSTLIRLIAGLFPPTTGFIYLDDQQITRPSARVGLMFQDANLMPWRTVIDNIALPLELAGMDKKTRLRYAELMLPTLGLSPEFGLAFPASLSGGMAQRVALGRVLIQQPQVLLLDEPFGALDAFTREQLGFDLVKMWAVRQPTVVMVTHNIDEAILLADRVIVFSARPGRIVLDLAVGLPRPRRIEDAYHEAFGQIAAQIRSAIEGSQIG